MGIPEPSLGKKVDSKEDERQYLKERLAAGFRVFAKYGFDEGVAGHISLRDPINPHAFWVNPFGLHFSLIKVSDLLLVDESGKVLEGGANRHLNLAAFMIHSSIHRVRPDINCAAHTHSLYGRTFCSLGRPLDIITQDSCAFYNDHVLYTNFKGVVMEEQEGAAIAEALGNKKAALLQNHGLLTTGGTIEETVFWFLSLDRCCHTQLLADAAAAGRGGATVKIEDKEAFDTWKAVGTRKAGHFSGKPLFDVIDFETNGDYKN
ncbi:arad-like aldolase/epimerase [Choiromyces venosus 120613-1]|uniref:Arad-like aldolase/epimerase n=1 Tax=Choiromyces venosus 120613-1 TaxID=1336337 RepID=A0A3N4J128_9PEZI|nr:arad-like aldolase/epimerase [Choiromyces venosus 120613-1]